MGKRRFMGHGPLLIVLFAVGSLAWAWLVERWEPLAALLLLLFITSLFPTGSQRDE
ncbi:MAG TPA: hypothetical protein VGE50_02890 [Gammaproteobacteria bacterium]